MVEDLIAERQQQSIQEPVDYIQSSPPQSQSQTHDDESYLSPQFESTYEDRFSRFDEEESQLTAGSLNLSRRSDARHNNQTRKVDPAIFEAMELTFPLFIHVKQTIPVNPFAAGNHQSQNTPSPLPASNNFAATSQKDKINKRVTIADENVLNKRNKDDFELVDSPSPSKKAKPTLSVSDISTLFSSLIQLLLTPCLISCGFTERFIIRPRGSLEETPR